MFYNNKPIKVMTFSHQIMGIINKNLRKMKTSSIATTIHLINYNLQPIINSVQRCTTNLSKINNNIPISNLSLNNSNNNTNILISTKPIQGAQLINNSS